MPDAQTITVLLRDLAAGEQAAFDRLIPLVYAELHRLARAQLRSERPGHTLQPTALVNEAYLRLAGREGSSFNDRAHFLGVAARTMRQILIDHARARQAGKRGDGKRHLSLDLAGAVRLESPSILIAIDDALKTLERRSPLMAQLIELRYFGGLTAEESAVVTNLEVSEVRRKLKLAQAWLRRELDSDAPGSGETGSSAGNSRGIQKSG